MLLSQLTVDPDRFQFRDGAFSEQTVAAIVEEGIILAKFDPVPIIARDNAAYCVAGDGHSRFEAIRRLAAQDRLPAAWLIGDVDPDWDIPCRLVTAGEARKLSWTANLSRDNFTPCEEAKVFQAMADAGMNVTEIARLTHKSTVYVSKTLPLNCLCRDIRVMVGLPEDAGGVDKYIAQAMAERFQRYEIDAGAQQQLWHRVFKHASLTCPFVRAVLDKIGQSIAGKMSDGMLFELPANVESVVAEFKDRAQLVRRAERGLSWLLGVKDSGILDGLPDLRRALDRHGKDWLSHVRDQTLNDAEIVGQLCLVA